MTSEETPTKEQEMPRQSFNIELIQGLIKIRNRDPFDSHFRQSTRNWLRQCIELERKRRGQGKEFS